MHPAPDKSAPPQREVAHERFPLRWRVTDLAGSTRGRGKRSGGMVAGAMAAAVGKSASVDSAATWGLSTEQAAEVDCMRQGEWNTYRRRREAGDTHDQAAVAAFQEG